jgi:hypothetical protein
MAFRLSASSTNIRRNQGNSNAELTVIPHRCSKVIVKQTRRRSNWKLGRTHKAIHEELQVDVQTASIYRRSQSLRTATRGNIKGIYPKVEYNQKLGSRSLR